MELAVLYFELDTEYFVTICRGSVRRWVLFFVSQFEEKFCTIAVIKRTFFVEKKELQIQVVIVPMKLLQLPLPCFWIFVHVFQYSLKLCQLSHTL